MDKAKTVQFIEESWNGAVLQTLEKYISIPNQSLDYDPEIHTNGYQEQAVELLTSWVLAQKVKGLKLRVLHDKGERTPLIFIEIDAFGDCKFQGPILMYGHFDKQPPLPEEWDEDLHPWKPVIKDGKLYGRGGADDGYAIFAAIDSIRILQAQNLPHPRCCVVVEGSEESGSPDLMYYLDQLKKEIGSPKVVICLDSGSGDYEHLWMTVSLRGLIMCTLKAETLSEGIHSGHGSGLVRDSFHILRHILDRIDNTNTGVMHKCLASEIPKSHQEYARNAAAVLGKSIYTDLPLHGNTKPQVQSGENPDEQLAELLLNQTWRPQLTVTGVDGLPDLKGGNVLRKQTTFKLSIRLPPNRDTQDALKQLREVIEAKPVPWDATVTLKAGGHTGNGFCCPEFAPWLSDSMEKAANTFFGKRAQFLGEGGSIPFMGELQRKYPEAQFVITGVLGPKSNAHGPNEFLDIAYCKNVICCVSSILADIGASGSGSVKANKNTESKQDN